ncbi:hypothetical protein QBC38DRAFT_452881 [Podospora fimiseda]|uniref:Uncharacterized protein n=1 Tax=Podospora fimiseda TaxID=252190 RepID=A0AAN7GYS3_9PEZI|nr:hypothetical protein QBC38DRAFT_452881 [Podospora fimiseda]
MPFYTTKDTDSSAIPSDGMSPRPLRLSQRLRSLGRLSRSGEREKSQTPPPFRGTHTPDRPQRAVSSSQAPSEQECSERIASWHRAVLENDEFDKDKDSWVDWTSETESEYSDDEKKKEVVEVEKPKGNKPQQITTLSEILSPVVDDRFSYGGESVCSPQLGEAEARQLHYRTDVRKVSHHPLLPKTKYEPEQLRQTYATEEAVKNKSRSYSPAPILPAKSAARAPRAADTSNNKHTMLPKRQSPPRRNIRPTPDPPQPKPRPQDFRPSLCPHCKTYPLPKTRSPLICPNCNKGLTTFPGTPIPPPLLKHRRILRLHTIIPPNNNSNNHNNPFPNPQPRPSAKQRLDDSLRRLRNPTPPPASSVPVPPSPAPTIWPSPSNLSKQQQKSGSIIPPISAPPPGGPLPGLPPKNKHDHHLKTIPRERERRQQQQQYMGERNSGSTGTNSRGSSGDRDRKGGRGTGGMIQLPIARSKFYTSNSNDSLGSGGGGSNNSLQKKGSMSPDLVGEIIGSYGDDNSTDVIVSRGRNGKKEGSGGGGFI